MYGMNLSPFLWNLMMFSLTVAGATPLLLDTYTYERMSSVLNSVVEPYLSFTKKRTCSSFRCGLCTLSTGLRLGINQL